ncbi:3-oxoacyl-[acyl-carrier protein] reductase [Fodinibius salinus]|uniref:3-oxoacyl-[acyl-carrier protein] reductase n=1 Tax=Fodinibius salinus TaxID=860790 RepID=A0A5D3YR51_9BACT|nr:SDR family oxidoreductase [Fodinibius salinus]TYP95483.1 3-oxoacyl-[acyl-carrier protein] reductase [Fodinibius salinus]
MQLSDIQALVTGGSSGIGRATAKMIIESGGEAVIAARTKSKLEQTAEDIGAIPIQCDVGDEQQVEELIQKTDKQLDNYNVLINNAGYGSHKKLINVSAKEMEDQLQTNTIGAMMVARESAKVFIDNDYGNIVNVSSSSGKRGYAGGTSYVASKFALSGMTQCWRAELRPHNIRVMQVNPSEVQTPFFSDGHEIERDINETKLVADDIAQSICDMLGMHDRAFITETSVWATNPK